MIRPFQIKLELFKIKADLNFINQSENSVDHS